MLHWFVRGLTEDCVIRAAGSTRGILERLGSNLKQHATGKKNKKGKSPGNEVATGILDI